MYLPFSDPVRFLICSAMNLIYRCDKDVLCFYWMCLELVF